MGLRATQPMPSPGSTAPQCLMITVLWGHGGPKPVGCRARRSTTLLHTLPPLDQCLCHLCPHCRECVASVASRSVLPLPGGAQPPGGYQGRSESPACYQWLLKEQSRPTLCAMRRAQLGGRTALSLGHPPPLISCALSAPAEPNGQFWNPWECFLNAFRRGPQGFRLCPTLLGNTRYSWELKPEKQPSASPHFPTETLLPRRCVLSD